MIIIRVIDVVMSHLSAHSRPLDDSIFPREFLIKRELLEIPVFSEKLKGVVY